MKTLIDGFEVSGRSYYFLLDWSDQNDKKFIADNFGTQSLACLNRSEYRYLWLHASNEEHKAMRLKRKDICRATGAMPILQKVLTFFGYKTK